MVTAVSQADEELLQHAKKDAADFRYTPCYCEENIYHLCKALSESGLAAIDASDLFVVFISNAIQQVPLWQQRNSSQADGLCVWDYHVICIQKASKSDEFLVWDPDTTLSLPVGVHKYVMGALRPDIPFAPKYSRLFRVIRASLFLRFFASDRRHMKNIHGLWLVSPPPYSCIIAEDGEEHNLSEYFTLTEGQVLHDREVALHSLQAEKFGVVLSQDGFLKLFSSPRTPSISGSDHRLVT